MDEIYLMAIIARVETGKNELTDFPQNVQDKLEMVEGKLSVFKEPTIEPLHAHTLEERVTDIEQVTEEVITALNEKGIVP